MIKRKDDKGRVLKDGESQRTDGRYVFRYTHKGKRKQIYAKTLQELRDLEDELDPNYEENDFMSYVELFEQFKLPTYGTSTQSVYKYALVRIKEYFGSCDVGTIKRKDILKFIVYLREVCKYKEASIKSYVAVLSLVFNLADDDGVIIKNPCYRIGEVCGKSNVKEALTVLETKQIEVVIRDYIENDMARMLAYVLLGTGIRISEALGLTWNDVNFNRKSISIKKQYDTIHHKFKPPKSKAGIREIPIPDKLVKMLHDYQSETYFKFANEVVDGYNNLVFMTDRGIPSISFVNLQIKRAIISYNKGTGNSLKNVTCHTLRHTFCTRKAEEGVPITVLQYIMGHSSVNMTLGVYAQSQKDTSIELYKKYC